VEDPVERLDVGAAIAEAELAGAEVGVRAAVLAPAASDPTRSGMGAGRRRDEDDHGQDDCPEGDPVGAGSDPIGFAEGSRVEAGLTARGPVVHLHFFRRLRG
jgi:hypothetical protein